MPFKQVTIIGTGLIGGSLGLALRKRHLARRVIGCDRAPVLERAIECGAIEAGAPNPIDAVHGSDLVVLATPVIAILDLIERLGPALSARTLVTDVGSTKADIVARAAKSFGRTAGQRFLAGHPMAGKEVAGVESADANLFEGAAWLFTPLPRQNPHAGLCGEFVECVEKLGARVAMLDAADHDRFCAWISHVPQMISTALAASLVDEFGPDAPPALPIPCGATSPSPTRKIWARRCTSSNSVWPIFVKISTPSSSPTNSSGRINCEEVRRQNSD
jgi:prephenate dehydrogenase